MYDYADQKEYRFRKYTTTVAPTVLPTKFPTVLPTKAPTKFPTVLPSKFPTVLPTVLPTKFPTVAPTVAPATKAPTVAPTCLGIPLKEITPQCHLMTMSVGVITD